MSGASDYIPLEASGREIGILVLATDLGGEESSVGFSEDPYGARYQGERFEAARCEVRHLGYLHELHVLVFLCDVLRPYRTPDIMDFRDTLMADDKTTEQNLNDKTIAITPVKVSGGAPAKTYASLVVLGGWEIGREIALTEDEIVFGRSLEADVTINIQSMSRQHAKIVRTLDGDKQEFAVHDMQSMNGTLVNNTQITEHRLTDGDKIMLGDALLKFVCQNTAEGEFYREVHRRIHYDQLTGLLALDSFLSQLEGIVNQAHSGTIFTLAMTDLDGLKGVNDSHGHLAGSHTIKEMGRLIQRTLRGQDRAGLYGGDECILLFPGTRLDEARGICEQLRVSIADNAFEHEGAAYRVSISQGLAEWPRHGRNARDLIAAADRALYEAKAAGRNCVRICED